MRRIITLTLAVLCLTLQPMSAQKEGNDNYKYYKAVELYEEQRNPQEARKLAVENLKDNPKHIASYLLIAKIDRRDEDYASALSVMDEAIKHNHKNSGYSAAFLLWWKGVIYDELGDTQRAVATMENVVKLARKTDKENLPTMMQNLAQFYYDVENYDAADKVYKEMIKIDESDLLPRVGLARNLNAREKYDEALAILDECYRYNKNYPEIYRFRMQSYEGKKEYKKMIDAMLTLYEKSEDPDYITIDMLKKDKKYSIAVLKEKIASESDNVFWRMALSAFYTESYMYSEALPIINGLIDEYGVDDSLLDERASCYDEMGMQELAIDDVNKALDICEEEDRPYFYMKRSNIFRYAGRYEEAAEDADKYVERYPTDSYGYYLRGWCKEKIGDLAGAMEDYNDAVAMSEGDAYIFMARGSLYLKNGDEEKAGEDFETVLAKDTTVNSESCRHFALLLSGKPEEAVQWMDKIIEFDSDYPGNWYDKACLLAMMGRADEAIEALRVSLEKGCRSFTHIEYDSDVDSIREREDFKALIEQYKEKLAEELLKVGGNVERECEQLTSEVDMKKMYGGTYEVPCSVNGLPLKMIFDTGASDVTISSVEANFMLKNGYLADSDIKGKRNYTTASGDIHEGTVIRLKEVKLGEAVLRNVEASVVHSQKAPLLLGQSVLEKFGTITIDNVNSKLLIKQ